MKASLLVVAGFVAFLSSCGPKLPAHVQQKYVGQLRHLCCNLHYESDGITDAHYYVGQLLPAGTTVRIVELGRGSIRFTAEGKTFTLHHEYGTEQETFEEYVSKTFVRDDPRRTIENLPPNVREAIRDARVEKGMTREEVVLSLGHPPAHRTPSLTDRKWTYWYNRWVTFDVVFGSDGRVMHTVGGSVPSASQPVR